MAMSLIQEHEVKLIQDVWQQVESKHDVVADLFYNYFFTQNPDLKILFKGDLDGQKRKMMTIFTRMASNVHRMEEMYAQIQNLAERHIGYSVKPEYYVKMLESWLWALDKGVNASDAAKTAWSKLYNCVAYQMIGVYKMNEAKDKNGPVAQSPVQDPSSPAKASVTFGNDVAEVKLSVKDEEIKKCCSIL